MIGIGRNKAVKSLAHHANAAHPRGGLVILSSHNRGIVRAAG